MYASPKISYWELKTYFSNVDYAVIGAGIVGYATALHLRKTYPDAKIIVIERGNLPSGASTKNAGFACFGSATELAADLRTISADQVWSTVEWRWKGLLALRELIGDKAMDFHQHGSWDLIRTEDQSLYDSTRDQIHDFNRQLERITGEWEVYREDASVADRFGFQGVRTSFYNRLEGQIDTAGLNQAFYRLSVQAGIHTLFGAEAQFIDDTDFGVSVQIAEGPILARHAFICTNGFASRFVQDEIIKPARAQVLVTEPIEGLKLKGTFHYQEGYYYFRNIDDRILFGGGRNLDFEGETTTDIEITDHIMDQLEHLLRTVIAPGQNIQIAQRWAGIMGVGSHKQPIIRRLSEHVSCGVRLGGMGVAIGTLVGQELASGIKS